ncbi:SNF2-related protein [Rhodococcus qingshengii]|uniref:SNF2-related protein n=1 Tax=Rhodococcus qingshengii TaxID=334542 RepID=UPI0035D8C04C
MSKTLRPYQAETIQRMKRSHSGLDGSEMGTGKTLVGTELLRAVAVKGKVPRALIIAPINTHRQWLRSFEEQYPSLKGSPYLRIIGTPKSDPESWALLTKRRPGVYIITWEAMRGRVSKAVYGDLYNGSKVTDAAIKAAMKGGHVPPWTRTGTWDLVIADESHRMQNRHSTTRRVIKMIKAHRRHASSGTAAGDRPEGLWSTLNWLWKEKYPNYWPWVEKHMEVKEVYISPTDTVRKIVGEKYPGSTIADIPAYVRWTLDEVADHLPDVIERVVTVPMGSIQRKQYDSFLHNSFAWIEENFGDIDQMDGSVTNHPVFAGLTIESRTRLRQAALGQLNAREVKKYGADDTWNPDEENKLEIDFVRTGDQPKVKAIMDIMDDLPEGEPLLVFTHAAKWAVMAAELLDKEYGPARAWTGALSTKKREELKEEFGSSVRVMVAQVASLAEGVDGLQHKARCEVWASPTDFGVINSQAMARLHRPGQKHKVQRWILQSEDSIDGLVQDSLDLKRDITDKMFLDEIRRARGRARRKEMV